MKRQEAIKQASDLITGDRAKAYGDALINHETIADGWNIIVQGAMRRHNRLLPAHVALMMDWVKTARLLNGLNHEDSWVDKIGYAALGAEFVDAGRNAVVGLFEEEEKDGS